MGKRGYEDSLINEPPSRTPVTIGGYGLRQAASGSQSRQAAESQTASEDWSSVGGLKEQLDVLKESVVFPLAYPSMFAGFGNAAPRGILLTGGPGTGKTLCVKALVGSLQKQGVNVTLFVRKGADTLSKYVGEGEKRLKEIFAEAKIAQPAIIFFDEIDGLAPARSNDSAQIHHTSLVTTLLALMDGIEHRGERVIVIGATNRPDALDAALRRPGRFDKELKFEPPRTKEQRREILNVCVRKWDAESKPSAATLDWLAEKTCNFTGADLQALTNQAVMLAFRRSNPSLYLATPPTARVGGETKLKITDGDFVLAIKAINPHRALSIDVLEANPSSIHLPVSELMSSLFKSEIAALTRCIHTAMGMTDSLPNYFQHNALYISAPEQHVQFPAVFRSAVLPAVIGNFSQLVNTISVSAYSPYLNDNPAHAMARIHSAVTLGPTIIVVDDSVFDDSLVQAQTQRAVEAALQAVLLPGNKSLGIFLGRTKRIGGIPYVNFVPKLDIGTIRQRISDVLFQEAEIAIREARALRQAAAPTSGSADDCQELFRSEIARICDELDSHPQLKKEGRVDDVRQKNSECQYSSMDEVLADFDAQVRMLEAKKDGAAAKMLKHEVYRLVRTIDEDVIENFNESSSKLHNKDDNIPDAVMRTVAERAAEVQITYNDWDRVASDVVGAVRFVQAKAADLV